MNQLTFIPASKVSLKPSIYLLLAVIIILFVTTIPNTKQTKNRIGYIQLNPLHQMSSLQCLISPCDISPRRVRSTLIDVLGNIILFLPFGVAACWVLKQRNWPNQSHILTAFAAGLLFSFGIETAQYWMPTRVTSLHDIILNSSGALVGALLLTLFYSKYSLLQHRWQNSVAVARLILPTILPVDPLKLQLLPIKYTPHRHPK